jgi:hypothetical protein
MECPEERGRREVRVGSARGGEGRGGGKGEEADCGSVHLAEIPIHSIRHLNSANTATHSDMGLLKVRPDRRSHNQNWVRWRVWWWWRTNLQSDSLSLLQLLQCLVLRVRERESRGETVAGGKEEGGER